VHANRTLRPGDFVQVKITKAYDFDLEGELV
jgi:ribosomal protein S12 methylthiotransferase